MSAIPESNIRHAELEDAEDILTAAKLFADQALSAHGDDEEVIGAAIQALYDARRDYFRAAVRLEAAELRDWVGGWGWIGQPYTATPEDLEFAQDLRFIAMHMELGSIRIWEMEK